MGCLRAEPVEIKWHTGLPVYASAEFLQSESSQHGWIGGIEGPDRLRCILPYLIIQKFGFKMVRFRTETISWQESLEIEEEKSFLNSAVEYFRSSGADLILPSGNTAIFQTYPGGASAAPYGTFVSDLTQPQEALWNGINTKFRQYIRKAISEKVSVESGIQYLDVSYKLVADTLRRSGIKFKSYEAFKRALQSFDKNLKLFVARRDGVPQACLVIPFSEHSAYSWYGGTTSEPVKGAMQLLHWEAICQLRQMGVKRFNFTGVRISPAPGSKQAGIMTFKMRFGGKLVQGYTWKYALRPIKSAAYTLAARLLMGGDIVDQERRRLASQ